MLSRFDNCVLVFLFASLLQVEAQRQARLAAAAILRDGRFVFDETRWAEGTTVLAVCGDQGVLEVIANFDRHTLTSSSNTDEASVRLAF